MKSKIFALGNALYKVAPSLYIPLYNLYKQITDQSEIKAISSVLQPGMVVADIGANIGVYSERFSKMVGQKGRVYSFEPDVTNFKFLKIRATGYSNIVTENSAVGSTTGMAKLFISDDLNVDHHMYDGGDGRGAIDISVTSLDDYFYQKIHLDFIKSDTQGYEFEVLKGGQKLLSSPDAPKILLEFWPYGLIKAGANPKDVIELLKGYGYRLEVIGSGDTKFDLSSVPVSVDAYVNIFAQK